jgi:Mrp family chromosome partitioning ATPase
MDPTVLKQEPERPIASIVRESAFDGTDTLTTLSRLVDVDPVALEHQRVLPTGATGHYGAPYKMLRTQILRRLDQLNANTFAVIGGASGAGKTLTAINLAIAIAADHDRTALLVDLDLRRPSIHTKLGIKCEVGIEDCLRNGRPLRDAMARLIGYERLVVLPARESCQDSSELLASQRTHLCIREMRMRYKDRVLIFDLPPVLQADDALAFSRHVQAALLVVGDGTTQRAEVKRTLHLLKDLPILGTVLNGSPDDKHSNYY